MKALGYICTFCFLCFVSRAIANTAICNQVELALFLGALIPIAMMLIATANGDMD